MRKNNLTKIGLFVTGLVGAVATTNGIQKMYNYTPNESVIRYHQIERINKTLDDAVNQSYNINFELDDLKMRESLSKAHEISNNQINKLSQNNEVKQGLLEDRKQLGYLYMSGVGAVLFSIAISGGIFLRGYNKVMKSLEKIEFGKVA